MRVALLVAIIAVVPACGDDGQAPADAADLGPPTVLIRSPNGGESFYPTSTVSIQWQSTGISVTGLVEAVNGTTVTPIASDVAVTPNALVVTSWSVTGLPEGMTYRIRVTATAANGMTGMDTSDNDFAIKTPAAVSFTTQVLPIFTSNCTGSSCHDNAMPAVNLELTAANAHGELVGVASTQCPANQLVEAGKPETSYLQFKLDGSGPCFSGASMPLGGQITPMQIQTIRDWIYLGALDN